ncbi:MAG: IclR family transcriptional regulator [Sphingomonadaceae bacterium]
MVALQRNVLETDVEEANGSSYDKLFSVLEAFAATQECSLTEVVERSALPFSTVHRIAGQLIDRGYLVRLRRGRYQLGPLAFALGRNSSMRSLLADAGRLFLTKLAKQCRTHVHLGIFEDDMVTYLANASFGCDDFAVREGMQLEAYCSGIGKILLAHLPEAARDNYLSQGDFVALTVNTIVDRNALASELKTVLQRGWATDLEEVETDLRCIAVPVRDEAGIVHAAISASVRSRNAKLDDLLMLLPALTEASAGLSARLFSRAAASGTGAHALL